ncbi:hypothetical protein [Quadrisphaera sp. DSM 44207]|uniref:hypothetical protein n=1 Tax=Quadrisphaera sp. DSM 44207 TaxID=1881057 RepID=UPI00088358AF|nr:hypothetical protein [Quadrisphaera sp. DSM 44207]SDQ63780.1 hypothetical protein SAMN05428996_2188 [Quadrisphaera sp. DSM 44207]
MSTPALPGARRRSARRPARRPVPRRATAAAAAALAAVLLTGCGSNQGEQAAPAASNAEVPEPAASSRPPGEAPAGAGAGAGDLGLTGQVGQQVELTGAVAEVLSPNAFTLETDEGGSTPVLVVASSVPAEVAQGAAVTASGTVAIFTAGEFEQALGVDLADEQFESYQGVAALQAQSVTPG